MTHTIRTLTADDEAIAWEMLQLDAHEPSLASLRAQPELTRYVEGWGREGDVGVVAVDGDCALGTAWVRLWPTEDKGYGYVPVCLSLQKVGIGGRAFYAAIAAKPQWLLCWQRVRSCRAGLVAARGTSRMRAEV